MSGPRSEQIGITLKSGQSLRLVIDFNALCDFERVMRREEYDAARELAALSRPGSQPPFGVLRALIWAALQAHHPALSLRDVGALLQDEGQALTEGLLSAMRDAAPDAAPAGAEAADPVEK